MDGGFKYTDDGFIIYGTSIYEKLELLALVEAYYNDEYYINLVLVDNT